MSAHRPAGSEMLTYNARRAQRSATNVIHTSYLPYLLGRMRGSKPPFIMVMVRIKVDSDIQPPSSAS